MVVLICVSCFLKVLSEKPISITAITKSINLAIHLSHLKYLPKSCTAACPPSPASNVSYQLYIFKSVDLEDQSQVAAVVQKDGIYTCSLLSNALFNNS